jgi:hypothetical protein
MQRSTRSQAEERFNALKKKEKQFVDEKEKARKRVSERIDAQRAARVARDEAEAEAKAEAQAQAPSRSKKK